MVSAGADNGGCCTGGGVPVEACGSWGDEEVKVSEVFQNRRRLVGWAGQVRPGAVAASMAWHQTWPTTYLLTPSPYTQHSHRLILESTAHALLMLVRIVAMLLMTHGHVISRLLFSA